MSQQSTEVSLSQINSKVSALEKNCFIDKLSNSSQSACSAAYSIRLLNSDYVGPMVRVRRGSDNTEQDFYGNLDGNLGTRNYAKGTSISTWLNGSTGYVRYWYDQSNNGRHVEQATYANQPSIYGTPVLDKLSPEARTAARGIYALYRASTSYTGPTIRIRRSTDNTEQDFYANVSGTLGTTLDGTGTSITEWLSSATAFVVTWHDQSGSGRHATQSTTSAQPVLNVASLLIDFLNDSARFLNMPSNTIPVSSLNSQYTFVTQHGTINNTIGGIISSGVQTNNQDNSLYKFNSTYRDNWWSNDYDYGIYSSGNKISVKYDGTNRQGYVNGTHFTAQTSSGRTTSSGQQYIGSGQSSNNYLNGELYFVYIFGSSLQDSDRIVCENTRTIDYIPKINYLGAQFMTLANSQLPPTAMTAHISGGYIASASSEGVVGWEAPKAFDFNSGTGWHSNGSIYNTSGLYIGSIVTTDINGRSYSGEWLQLQCPNSVNLNNFTITPRSGLLYRTPRDFAVLGSNNGNTWKLLYEDSNVTWSTSASKIFTLSNRVDSYKYFRLVSLKLDANANTDSVQIMEWTLRTLPPLTAGEKTYAFYANWNSNKSSGNSVIIEQLTASNNSRASLFKLGSYYGFSGYYNDLLQLVKIPVAKDTKTVMVINDALSSNNITIYHNGFVHQGTTDYPTTLSVGTSSFTIGSNYNAGEYHSGCINEVIVISNSVRSTDAMLYYTPNDDTIQRMPDPKPKVWINFDPRDGRRLLTSSDTKAKTLCNTSFLQDLPNNTAVADCNGYVQNVPSYRPTYYNRGGYSNNLGYINFTRGFPGQYLNGGSRTFNIATNGGFTAVVFAKFVSMGSTQIAQRVFDFGNGSPNNNILVHLQEGQKGFAFYIFEGTTGYLLQSGANAITEGEWALWGFRYTTSTKFAEIIKNGTVIASTTHAVSAADRTLTNTYIGASNWSGEGTINMQLAGLNIYDYYLSDSELSAVGNYLMYSDISTLPQYLSEYNNVVPTGLITYTNNVPTMLGLAAKFNGSAGSFYDLQDVPNVPLTFSFWFNAQSSSYSRMFALTDNARSSTNVGISIDYPSATNQLTIYCSLPNQLSAGINITGVSVNTWYHLTVTINTNFQVQAYLNGVYQNQLTGTALPDARSRMIIGSSFASNGGGFNGFISDFRVYDYILRQEDISNIYNALQRSRQLTLTPPENYLVNHYNWYSKMTLSTTLGSFTPISGGSRTAVQYQLLSSASTSSRNVFWNTTRIQDYNSFVCSFEIYTSSATADGLWFFCGSTGLPTNLDSSLSGFITGFQVYNQLPFAPQGICLVNNSNSIVSQSYYTDWVNSSKWSSVIIKYKRDTVNTWVVNVDGKDIITYSNPNNESWISNSGEYWGIGAFCGGSTMNSYIRRVELTYQPRISSISSVRNNMINYLKKYPEGPLTSDNSNGCIATASTYHTNDGVSNPFYGFDNNKVTRWTNSIHTRYDGNGAFLSNTSTTVDGINYLGDWLQIQLQTPIKLQKYSLFPHSPAYFPRSPKNFVIAGSNDGTTWALIDSRSNISDWTSQGYTFDVISSDSYRFYRIIITSKVSGDSWLSIGEWELYAYPTVSYKKYPESNLTSNTSFNCIASASDTTSGYEPWKAFDGNLGESMYYSGSVYNSTTGVYSGAISTTVSGSNYSGVWLQIQLPAPVIIKNYTITGRSTFETTQSPNTWIIAGSNDGTTWTLIDSRSGITNWSTTNITQTFSVPDSTYQYFRMICSVTGQVVAAQRAALSISELTFYGNSYFVNHVSNNIENYISYPNVPFVKYPEINLTSNSSSSCVASSSSVLSSYAAWKAFDGISGDNFFHSNTPSGVITTVSGSNYSGEWLQIQLPSAITLKHYTIACRTGSGLEITQSPNTWILAGSNNGTTWSLIDSRSGITNWSSSNVTQTFNVTDSTYQYFRIIISVLGNSFYDTYLIISELSFYGNPPLTIEPEYVSKPNLSLEGYATGTGLGSIIPGCYVYDSAGNANNATLLSGSYRSTKYIRCGAGVARTTNVTFKKNSGFLNIPTFTQNHIVVLEFSTSAGYWGHNIGFGYDLSNNNLIEKGSLSEQGHMFLYEPVNSNMYFYNRLVKMWFSPWGKWYRFRIVYNLQDGDATVFIRDETSNHYEFKAIPEFTNVPLNLDWTSNTVTNPGNWNALTLQSESDSMNYEGLSVITYNASSWKNNMGLYGVDNGKSLITLNNNMPQGLIPGLTWKFFNGDFNSEMINNFVNTPFRNIGLTNNITNVNTGTNGNYPVSSGDSYSVEWTGYFRPNVTGTWTLTLFTDDKGYLWIGSPAAAGYTTSNATITTNVTTVSSTVQLIAGVYYPIRIRFSETGGGDDCRFSFTSPNGSTSFDGNGYFFSSNGLNSAYPGESAQVIKEISKTNSDGIYYININGFSTPTYCLMNDHYDGGGWMMLMKGTRGTTFNYSSNYWTSANTLNGSQTNRNDGDAKYDAFNYMPIKDVMAIFPDVPSATYTNELGVRGGSLNLEDGWCWKVNNWNTATRTTALAGFQNSRDAAPSNPYRFNGFSNQIFSSQTGAYRHVFGGGTHISSNRNVRWGLIFNDGGDFSSVDCIGGIGMSTNSYSAGDFWQYNTLALNRSMRFELFGR